MEVCDMKKIKANEKQKKAPMKESTKILIYALIGIAFLITAVLVIIENTPNRIVVKNNTGKNLEYVRAYFVGEDDQLTDTVEIKDIKSGDTAEIDLEKINLSYKNAVLEVRFKFEGYDELFTDAGYFNDVFDGKITISFNDSDNDVLLKVKATTGLLSNPNIDCNEEYKVNLDEGYVAE